MAVFRATAGLGSDVPPASFGGERYVAWTDWRMEEITDVGHAIRDTMGAARAGLTLRAALIAEAGLS